MGNNLPVPYSSFINGGVHDGTDVIINARPSPNFNSFSINLCSGPNLDSGDVALHFNPRFNNGSVVRNHLQNGSWGAEETAGGMPFRRGHTFNLHMKVQGHNYKVTINNRHFCDFTHRVPKESVQYLYIEGDIHIETIQFQGRHGHHGHHGHGGHQFGPGHHHPHQPPMPGYPQGPICPPGSSYPGFPPTPGFPPAPAYPPAGGGFAPPYPGPAPGGPIYNPPVPVNTPIQGGFYPGKIIYITGVPFAGAQRFHVNLACGFQESSDLALHFDVRFNYGNDRNVAVRCHRAGGNYGNEERHQSYFPFMPGLNFEMMILCEPQGLKIAVNNQHFVEFNHRIQPIQRIDHVQVQGEVTVSQIRFQ